MAPEMCFVSGSAFDWIRSQYVPWNWLLIQLIKKISAESQNFRNQIKFLSKLFLVSKMLILKALAVLTLTC